MATKDFLAIVASTVFGSPDATKTGLIIRGILITFALPLPAIAIDVIGQLVAQLEGATDIVINHRVLFRFYLDALLPSLGIWLAGLRTWLEARDKEIKARLDTNRARVHIGATDRLIELGVEAPRGTTVEDVKAIYVSEAKQQKDQNGN